MRRNLLIAATLFALAGCSEQKPEAAQTTAPASASTASAASTAATTAPVCTGADCDLLPPNVVVVVTHKLRREHTYSAKPGDDRKQVVFEYMDGTPDANMQSIEQSMAAAGFNSAIKQDGTAAGTVSASFRKDGYGKVNVWVSGDVGERPKWPKAKGVIGFDFPAPPATATQTAGN